VDDIDATVIADGFWTASDICTPAYAAECEQEGIR
jgi:D-xylose transport system substrate-binding protein